MKIYYNWHHTSAKKSWDHFKRKTCIRMY